jgi:signal transduction histidine kinase/phage shock protein PspC (stress-responsive transcriptional regulator)
VSESPVLRRPETGRLVAGVCAGLAEHLGVSVGVVRLVLVLLTFLGGFGALLYAGLWLAVPVGTPERARPPGLDAATRMGRRPSGDPPAAASSSSADPGLLVALALVGVGLVMLADRLVSTPAGAFWPLAVVAVGAAVVWRQAEAREASRAAVIARLVAGVAVVAIGLALFLAGRGELGVLLDALAAVLVVLAGIALVAGPWLLRLLRDLQAERAERVRSQERADMAAHLHDSVLQTLAVIQRQAHDPEAVSHLARAQERDLRRWLYDQAPPQPDGVRSALEAVAAEVEDGYGVPVEVVVVGDAAWQAGGPTDAVVAATREALTNAAKHSGAARIDLYAELGEQQVEVFVRDRGTGFDPACVGADRQGVRGSIVERMQRSGGRATVTSAPGDGTEVHVVGPLAAS